MKILLICCLCFFLAGCSSETVWETVSDTLPESKQVWQEQSYAVDVPLPESLKLVEETENERLLETDDEHYEVSAYTYLASSLNSAVKYVSGLESSELTVLQTSRFGLPEYHFAWYTQTEQGGYLCQADLLMEDMTCYAVVVRAPENESGNYSDCCRQVFSAFGLSSKETV